MTIYTTTKPVDVITKNATPYDVDGNKVLLTPFLIYG